MTDWQLIRDVADDLADRLALARGGQRLHLARGALRDARAVMERMTGPEAQSIRALLAALEASHREIAR